jgi:hypothetical protein
MLISRQGSLCILIFSVCKRGMPCAERVLFQTHGMVTTLAHSVYRLALVRLPRYRWQSLSGNERGCTHGMLAACYKLCMLHAFRFQCVQQTYDVYHTRTAPSFHSVPAHRSELSSVPRSLDTHTKKKQGSEQGSELSSQQPDLPGRVGHLREAPFTVTAVTGPRGPHIQAQSLASYSKGAGPAPHLN